jgi:cytochrome c
MMLKRTVIAVVLCLFVAVSVSAQQRGTPAEAKAMVEKAVAYIKANGQEKAFAEINNPKGMFVDRDLYITVYDMNGKCLAHGAIPDYIGKNFIGSKDPDGKFFIQERIEAAKTKGSSWQTYKFIDPLTKKVEPKEYYFEKYGTIVVGCGAYKPGK